MVGQSRWIPDAINGKFNPPREVIYFKKQFKAYSVRDAFLEMGQGDPHANRFLI